jgi:hypothetical protein
VGDPVRPRPNGGVVESGVGVGGVAVRERVDGYEQPVGGCHPGVARTGVEPGVEVGVDPSGGDDQIVNSSVSAGTAKSPMRTPASSQP